MYGGDHLKKASDDIVDDIIISNGMVDGMIYYNIVYDGIC